jgi:RNA recognition motif-containing protein
LLPDKKILGKETVPTLKLKDFSLFKSATARRRKQQRRGMSGNANLELSQILLSKLARTAPGTQLCTKLRLTMTNFKNGNGRRVVSSSTSHSQKFDRPRAAEASTHGVTNRVYVGNLKYEVSWQDLKDHMRSAGEVVRADILTDASGRSKGCGLVEFASARDARTAIATLNDTDLDGRSIFVREDREAGPSASSSSRPERSDRAEAAHPAAKLGQGKSVYVGNLSWDVEWQNLKDHMRQAGEVVHADVLKEPSGRSKGCGIVEFASIRDANNAIRQLNDTELMGRLIFVREDREAEGGTAGSARMEPRRTEARHTSVPALGTNRLYVGNLEFRTKWFELKDHFRSAGNVTRADIAMEDDGVRSRGYGIVEFATEEEAAYAVAQLNNTVLNGREIFVREDREEKRRM